MPPPQPLCLFTSAPFLLAAAVPWLESDERSLNVNFEELLSFASVLGWHKPFLPFPCPSDTSARYSAPFLSYQLALANGFSVWVTHGKCLKMQEQGEGYQEMVELCTGNCSDPPAREVMLD